MHVGQAAAKQGDRIVALDTHIVLVPVGGSLVPTALPHAFDGVLSGRLSPNVNIMKKAAATVGSTADNRSAHIPTVPGQSFQKAPGNKGEIVRGSPTVNINGKAAARHGDVAETCNDPQDQPVGKVVAAATVFIG
jgi:uncharacterized Zn-binding protein involved in type VI secretion